MLDADHIRTIAAREKLNPGTIEKDYVLSKTIMSLAQLENFQHHLVFKGGTALKKCYYPSWRYSEDLDFTARDELPSDRINTLFDSTVKKVESLFGVSMRVSEYSQYPRHGTTIVSAQLKLSYDGPLRKTSGLKNNIRIDIALDETIVSETLQKKVKKQYADDIDATVPIYSLEEIIAEKLRSILQRGKSRDYYDVWVLLKGHNKDFSSKLMIEIMKKKCKDGNIPVPKLDDFFLQASVDEAGRYWERGLAHQVTSLASFDVVLGELKSILRKII
jgi:predicted nucleotidyltransferase component of viral defense system